MIRSLMYSVKQAFIQISRNMTMTISSLFSITAMLLILGMFFILAVNVNLLTVSAKEHFDLVEIYLLDEATDDEVKIISNKIENLSYVDDIEYLDKDDAMDEMSNRWGNNSYLLDGLTSNPLPRSIRVHLKDIKDSQKLVDYVKEFKGIEDIKYSESEVKKILKITDGIQIGALVIIIFLIFVSVIVVSNTIKLTVLARGREISIMKYVGATNWFIRGPFLVEGIIIGIIAALISAGVVRGLYTIIENHFSDAVLVILSTNMVPASFMTYNLLIIFLSLGVSIGSIGSLISMRRFLDT